MSTVTGHKQSRHRKRAIAVFLICALFATIPFRPAPARADTEETLIYAAIGVGIYATVIILATLAIYRHATPDSSAVPIDSLERTDADSLPVKPGTRCPQRDGQVTLVCW